MANTIINKLTLLINSIIDVISQGSFERVKVVKEFNLVFSEAYLSGEFDRLCKVSIGIGDLAFRHSMSTFYLRSGFKITIQNDDNLTGRDIQDIAKYILASNSFIRQLMALGFDTLFILGKHNTSGVKLKLSDFGDPNKYLLNS